MVLYSDFFSLLQNISGNMGQGGGQGGAGGQEQGQGSGGGGGGQVVQVFKSEAAFTWATTLPLPPSRYKNTSLMLMLFYTHSSSSLILRAQIGFYYLLSVLAEQI